MGAGRRGHRHDPVPAVRRVLAEGAGRDARAVLVVDTANVMGSRNDGWWRDRHGAAIRLRDQIDGLVGCRSNRSTSRTPSW